MLTEQRFTVIFKNHVITIVSAAILKKKLHHLVAVSMHYQTIQIILTKVRDINLYSYSCSDSQLTIVYP